MSIGLLAQDSLARSLYRMLEANRYDGWVEALGEDRLVELCEQVACDISWMLEGATPKAAQDRLLELEEEVQRLKGEKRELEDSEDEAWEEVELLRAANVDLEERLTGLALTRISRIRELVKIQEDINGRAGT